MAAASRPLALPRSDEPAVSVVVLLTDDVGLARECLGAVAAAHDDAVPTEVVAVLNASGPEVQRLVEDDHAGARTVRSAVNTGTAVGWNLGFEAARAPWVALIHEDSAPRPGWLGSLLGTARAHPAAGAVGSRLLLPDGSLENGGWVLWRDGAVTQLDAVTAPSTTSAHEPYPVDQCSSASLMVDRAAWSELGGFDERYFPAVYADTDLCTALWALGRPVLSDPGSVVVHRKNAMVREGGGALRGHEYQRFLRERHRARFVAKWGDVLEARPSRDPAVDPAHAAAEAALALCARRFEAGPPEARRRVAERRLTRGRPDDLERRLLAAQLEVQAEFCDALLGVLHERDTELAAREPELAELRRRAITLDRILAGRTWRTRNAVRRLLRR